MNLIILLEQTGKNNYIDIKNCPIASALKNAGYEHVTVGPYKWKGIKRVSGLWGLMKFSLTYTGVIPDNIHIMADQYWSKNKYSEDIKFTLPKPRIIIW